MIDLGTVLPGSTLRIPFSSFDKDDGSSITMTNYSTADILIYKDGSTTERASTAGYTATTDLDGKTGKHLAIIDLADDTTADFFKAGSEYLVAIDAVTVDAVTTGGWIARFRIGYPGSQLDTSIATLASQTSFTLTAGPAEDDALNGHEVIIHDKASAVQSTRCVIEDYTGSTKTVTLRALPATTFTIAAGDNVSVRELVRVDVSHFGGAAGTFASGRPEVNTSHAAGTAWGSGAITAGAIAAAALNGKGDWNIGKTGYTLTQSFPANFAAMVISASGVVDGSVVQWKGVTAAAVDAAGYPVVTIKDGTGAGELDTLNGKVLIQGTPDNLADLNDPTPAAIATAVWDALTSALTTVGSIGKLLVDRIDAAITSRMATFALPTNFSALLINGSGHVSRVTLADTVTTLTGHTAQSGDSFAVVSSVTFGNSALKTLIDALDDYVDTEVAAIKAKTDLIVDLTATRAEPGQVAPNATIDPLTKLDFLYKAWRNKKEKTATASKLYNSTGAVVDQKTTDSDDGTTGTRGVQSAGP